MRPSRGFFLPFSSPTRSRISHVWVNVFSLYPSSFRPTRLQWVDTYNIWKKKLVGGGFRCWKNLDKMVIFLKCLCRALNWSNITAFVTFILLGSFCPIYIHTYGNVTAYIIKRAYYKLQYIGGKCSWMCRSCSTHVDLQFLAAVHAEKVHFWFLYFGFSCPPILPALLRETASVVTSRGGAAVRHFHLKSRGVYSRQCGEKQLVFFFLRVNNCTSDFVISCTKTIYFKSPFSFSCLYFACLI